MQAILGNPAHARGGYSNARKSPYALAATVAVHAIVIGAILLMPGQKYIPKPEFIFPTKNIPEVELPPPPEPEKTQPEVQPSVLDRIVETATLPDTPVIRLAEIPVDIIPYNPPKPTDPLPAPVVVQARPDPRYMGDFQPGYPAAMLRQDVEGYAKVRVHISVRGRVDSVELVDATDTAFWEATRRQALKYWRFKPAMRDGVAVPSEQVMTVRFQLDSFR